MFRYRGETGAMPACHTNAVYWGVFAPEDHWLVIRSGVSDVSSGAERLRIRVNATYQSWRGKSLFPKEIVLAYESRPDGRIVEVRRTSFGIPENSTSVGEEQFYLPHYGISEAAVPTFVDRGRGYRIAAERDRCNLASDRSAVLEVWAARCNSVTAVQAQQLGGTRKSTS